MSGRFSRHSCRFASCDDGDCAKFSCITETPSESEQGKVTQRRFLFGETDGQEDYGVALRVEGVGNRGFVEIHDPNLLLHLGSPSQSSQARHGHSVGGSKLSFSRSHGLVLGFRV